MIYMDNAATTKICQAASKAMAPYLDKQFGNPSGRYSLGFACRSAVEKSRVIIANAIGCSPDEIYFTSGGTESDNWAIKSIMSNKGKQTPTIITSQIEHKAVLNTCNCIENEGCKVNYLNVDEKGFVSLEELERAIDNSTRIISIMTANNEIGTVEPIEKIGNIARANNIIFHTDAVQAFGHIPINVKKMKIDMLSASGHKFGAPKGCGFLYISKKLEVDPFINGGSQERGKRSGTENVAGIVAMGAATEHHISKMRQYRTYTEKLRDYIIEEIENKITGVHLNGDERKRLPGNISMSIDGVVGAAVVEELDKYGICISAGSACAEGKGEPSHVLTAIGLEKEHAISTIRITVNNMNTYDEADYMIDKLIKCVKRLRNK